MASIIEPAPAVMTSSTTAEPVSATRYTETDHTVSDSTQVVNGHHVDVTSTEDTHSTVNGEFDDRAAEFVNGLIRDAENKRQAIEDVRANHRNFNRLLTLLGAIVLGIIVTYFFQNDGFPIFGIVNALAPHTAKILSGYSFVITVALDTTLALYSLIRHY